MRKLEEKFRENTTLKYYNENATSFSATTQIVDFSTMQDKFLALLQPNAYILDFGCGSGRDTKYFMEHGYGVEATDGSEELCKLASTYTGVLVKYMLFQELDEQKKYDGKSMMCRKLQMLPIECIVRGYITGSGWASYQKNGTVCGIKLPDGLKESQKLPEPIYTPSTKAEIGDHEENI